MKLRKFNFLLFMAATSISLTSCNETSQTTGEYKISFNSNGGSAIEEMKAQASSRINAPTQPTRNGYDFTGWYTDPNFSTKFQFSYMPNNDLNLYAKWTLKNFVINYDVGDGENNESNPDFFNVNQNNIRLYDPIYEGHFFAGWFEDASFTKAIAEINTETARDYNLFAKWADVEVINDYNINYHLNGGTNNPSNPATFNKNDLSFALLAPTKNGSTFKGWYQESSYQNIVTLINTSTQADIDVYAKWEETPVIPTYTITYHLNGGTNPSNPVRYTEDMADINLSKPIKYSCTFKGWFEDEDFTTPITKVECSRKENLDIYAKWVNGIQEQVYDFDLGIGKDFTLYHVTDTHINDGDSESVKKRESNWIDDSRYGYAASFGDKYDTKYLCNSSTQNFKAIVNYINSEAPDAACFTGDIMDCYNQLNFDFVNTEMAKCTVPYLYALGNHEDPSSNYVGMTGMDTIAFSVIDLGEIEIVCMDNTVKDAYDCYSYNEEQYNLLKAETEKNKPIILMQHIPLLTSENCGSRLEQCGSYFFIDENACSQTTKKVVDLICTNDNIKLILCGHIHGTTLTYVAPNKPQLTCSSGLIGIINKVTIH